MLPLFGLCSPPPTLNTAMVAPVILTLSHPDLLFCLPLYFCRPYDYIGPAPILQDYLPVSKPLILQSPFSHARQHIHRFQWRILGSFIVNTFATAKMLAANMLSAVMLSNTTRNGFTWPHPIQVSHVYYCF